MISVDLSRYETNHTQRIVKALATSGWRALSVPSGGNLENNRQVVELRSPNKSLKVRFCVYSIGDRGESHRRDERRIQITTTYRSGLPRLSGCSDIVLGYDRSNDVFVGLDPRRLGFGGEMHNASSSVDRSALEQVSTSRIDIRPHDTELLGLEYQAIFKAPRIAEYAFNLTAIHRNQYSGSGWFSAPASTPHTVKSALRVSTKDARSDLLVLGISSTQVSKTKIKKRLLTAYENDDRRAFADLTPEELDAVQRRCREIGDRGEYFTFHFEKHRLRKAGKLSLAHKVEWVSRRAVGMGYDIRSFEEDGTPRFIEVKSTNGRAMVFFMSDNEWRVATAKGESYCIYRIVEVDDAPRLARLVRNPLAEENERTLERTPTGWRVKLN